MIYILLIAATLITSLISGILSMAGGIILMGVFGFFLSIPAAMVLHGVAQTASNGSRIALYRQHLRMGVVIPYSFGSLLTLGAFMSVSLIPNKGIMFLLIGSFPFLAMLIPKHFNLDIEKKPIAIVCGVVVTAVQLLAGASGPVLDIFYTNSTLNRFEILGTKAITQTLGHVLKLFYYAFFLNLVIDLPQWIFPAVVVIAILGNWVAKQFVKRIDDHTFKQAGRYIIMTIGTLYFGKGLLELFL